MDAEDAERWASGAAGSGSAADAGRRRLHAFVRLGEPHEAASGGLLIWPAYLPLAQTRIVRGETEAPQTRAAPGLPAARATSPHRSPMPVYFSTSSARNSTTGGIVRPRV